jgi:hypothetical protein
VKGETNDVPDQMKMPPDSMFLTPNAKKAWLLFQKEIATYRRELPRLLQEGEAGRYALIKGEHILSIWETSGDASQAGYERFGLDESFCVQKIDPCDPERWAQIDAWIDALSRG